jgi:hypothetical protein
MLSILGIISTVTILVEPKGRHGKHLVFALGVPVSNLPHMRLAPLHHHERGR